jgi:drug/metabolite transporter (DMT)-like permease
MQKGVFFAIASAVIYGSTSVLARLAYDEGTNGVTMSFLRTALALPFLFMIIKIQKIPFATSREEKRDLLLAGLASAVTTLSLYGSYAYIPVGEAATLFFIYPALVSLGCVLFYKEKLTKAILVALCLSVAGVSMFSENLSFENMRSGGTMGFLLALTAGFSFAFYVVRVDKSSLRRIPAYKITFVVCAISALFSGTYGGSGFAGGLAFNLSPKGWAYVWVVALSVSLGAIILLQLGIKYTGAPTAAILSTFEPITSVFCGALFLGERLSFPKVIGCACVVASVILVAAAGSGTKK